MIVGPAMGDGHETAGEKGMDDSGKKNQCCHQVERLLPDTPDQNRKDAVALPVRVALQIPGKIDSVRRFRSGSPGTRGQ